MCQRHGPKLNNGRFQVTWHYVDMEMSGSTKCRQSVHATKARKQTVKQEWCSIFFRSRPRKKYCTKSHAKQLQTCKQELQIARADSKVTKNAKAAKGTGASSNMGMVVQHTKSAMWPWWNICGKVKVTYHVLKVILQGTVECTCLVIRFSGCRDIQFMMKIQMTTTLKGSWWKFKQQHCRNHSGNNNVQYILFNPFCYTCKSSSFSGWLNSHGSQNTFSPVIRTTLFVKIHLT